MLMQFCYPTRLLRRSFLLVPLLCGTALAQPALLLPAEPVPSGGFGFSVAADGRYMVAGAPGVMQGTQHGVFVFERTGGGWAETAAIRDAEGSVGDSKFGASVSIDGDRLIVGAEFNAGGGGAFIFVRTADTWTQEATLLPAPGTAGEFGYHVLIRGDLALVGAPDLSGERNAAFLYRRGSEGWALVTRLVGSDTGPHDNFGLSVAIAGPQEVWVAAPLNQNETGLGAVYRFVEADGVWTEAEKVVRPSLATGGQFGYSIAVDGDQAVIGAPAFLPGWSPEGAWVFRRAGDGWVPDGLLQTDTPIMAYLFGYWVDVRGEVIAVGSPMYNLIDPEPRAALAAPGDRFTTAARDFRQGERHAGAVFVYERGAASWTLRQEVRNPEPLRPEVLPVFGWATALADGDVIVGDHRLPLTGPNSGVVYAYGLDATPSTEPGAGVAAGLRLDPPYPNPSAGRTAVAFEIAAPQRVRVEVFDALGRRAAGLHDGVLASGRHTLEADLRRLPSGGYVLRVSGEQGAASKRVSVVR